MRRTVVRYALPLLSIVALSYPALAQTVDNHGANELKASLSRYLGSTVFDKGAIRIAPDGDAYRLEIDFNAIIRLFPGAEVTFDPYPQVLSLKPRPDGTWDVANTLRTGGWFSGKGPNGPQSMQWTVTNGKMTGTYDPALAAFSSLTFSSGAGTMTMQAPDQDTQITIGSANIEAQSARSARSGVDFSMTQDISNLAETVTVKQGGDEFPVAIRASRVTSENSASRLQSKPLLDLLAFAVANGDEAKIKAKQTELKALLLAALPLWNKLQGEQQWHDVSIVTPLGDLSASSMGFAVSMDGISQQSAISYRLRAADLKGPTHLLPAWAVPLLPSDIDIGLGGKDLNVEAPLSTFIATFDLNKVPPVPDDVEELVKRQFLEKEPKLVVAHSSLGNKDYRLEMEGEMTFVDEKPAFHAVIDMAGYDKIVDALKAGSASEPTAMQAFTGLLAMKGFSRTLPDGRLQWAVDMRRDGALLVNGSMIAPPDAQP